LGGAEGAHLLDACCVFGGSSLFAVESGEIGGKGVASLVLMGRVAPAVHLSRGNGLLPPVNVGSDEPIDRLFVPGLGETAPAEASCRRLGEMVQHQVLARVEREVSLCTRRGAASA
jgi:hypothetical protein